MKTKLSPGAAVARCIRYAAIILIALYANVWVADALLFKWAAAWQKPAGSADKKEMWPQLEWIPPYQGAKLERAMAYVQKTEFGYFPLPHYKVILKESVCDHEDLVINFYGAAAISPWTTKVSVQGRDCAPSWDKLPYSGKLLK